jgi:hypothetical protein
MGTDYQPDSVVDDTLIEVKRGTDAVSTIRSALLKLAYAVTDQGQTTRGILLVIDPKITDERLDDEEKYAKMVLAPGVSKRLGIVVYQDGELSGCPDGMTIEVRRELGRLAGAELAKKVAKIHSGAAYYEIFKILVHQWLLGKGPMTALWLAKTAGFSYPTVRDALRRLGSMIKRQTDRRFELAYFPREEFARLLAVSDRARATARFTDRSGQPRSPEAHLRRLEKLNVPDIAIGGVTGARHYHADLNLGGTPRLDLSLHCPGNQMNLGFIEKLDPALKRVDDPQQPANVVIHAVRHANPLFQPRDGGLQWADPVECLLDLHEMRLESQAHEFLNSFPPARGKT